MGWRESKGDRERTEKEIKETKQGMKKADRNSTGREGGSKREKIMRKTSLGNMEREKHNWEIRETAKFWLYNFSK